MKIVVNTLEQIAGVEIYPIISLLIFFIFFAIVTYMAMTSSKEYIDEMKNLPLDKDDDFHNNSNN
jgi:cytochrome c oxidase cbb3-type subunit IV